MEVREKLVELLKTNACPSPFMCDPACRYYGYGDCFPDRFADHLISHGVTVQERDFPEQDYYVLRNTETGMYFRGKGANRWGKHFNQATIYRGKGTAEHTIKEVALHGEKAELVRIKIVEMPQLPK